MDAGDIYHAQTGRAMIRFGQRDLKDDPGLWAEVWGAAREELLRDWIAGHPGSRPPAWWRFDAPAAGIAIRPDESEVEALDRSSLISADELEAIRRKTIDLVEFNRGRNPVPTPAGHYKDNFVPPSDLHRFAAARELIPAADAAILNLDSKGKDLP